MAGDIAGPVRPGVIKVAFVNAFHEFDDPFLDGWILRARPTGGIAALFLFGWPRDA
jgi:hypothetical protein